jgi:hypothetical protein
MAIPLQMDECPLTVGRCNKSAHKGLALRAHLKE